MRKLNNKLIDKVLGSFDWDSISEVNKCFKHGIGESTSAIPGIKRKPWSEEITINDLKTELKCLIKFVIDNDISELSHGYWLILWNNADWGQEKIQEVKEQFESKYSEEDEIDIIWEEIQLESTLEVIFSPQRICVVDNSNKIIKPGEDSDFAKLETMLQKALKNEQYELASKLKDVIRLQKGEDS